MSIFIAIYKRLLMMVSSFYNLIFSSIGIFIEVFHKG